MHKLQKTGENLLPAIAYGDAAGLPTEFMTAAKIRQVYGRVDHLLAPAHHDLFAGAPAGTVSDDTQASVAVIEGLMAADEFDLHAQADSHIRAMAKVPRIDDEGELVPRGWGGSTRRSITAIMEGTDPYESGAENGVGSGVLMKLSPLVLWQAARGTAEDECHTQYDQLTNMTHRNSVARWATRVHGDFLMSLLHEKPAHGNEMGAQIIALAKRHGRELDLSDEGSQALDYLQDADSLSGPMDVLNYTDGAGFYAPQTLAMAYGLFVPARKNFHRTVYHAVNLGGDTDSIASISAAMANFEQDGEIELPADANLLEGHNDLQRLSAEFIARAMKA